MNGLSRIVLRIGNHSTHRGTLGAIRKKLESMGVVVIRWVPVLAEIVKSREPLLTI